MKIRLAFNLMPICRESELAARALQAHTIIYAAAGTDWIDYESIVEVYANRGMDVVAAVKSVNCGALPIESAVYGSYAVCLDASNDLRSYRARPITTIAEELGLPHEGRWWHLEEEEVNSLFAFVNALYSDGAEEFDPRFEREAPGT
jgi:hypothetical protein